MARLNELFSLLDEAERLRTEAAERADAMMPAALYEIFSRADERGWRWVRLGDVGKYVNGRAFKPEEWENEGLPIIRIQNLTNKEAPFNYYSKPVEEKYLVKNGDLLISWSATLGAFIWEREKAVLNQHIFKVIENKKLIQRAFLFYIVKYVLYNIQKETHGSTMKHITKKKFENIKIPLPPLEEQRRIVARLDQLQQQIDELQRLQRETKEKIECTRASVLDKAFRGEL